jgi:ABC-2 type transport system ATP-binding protein
MIIQSKDLVKSFIYYEKEQGIKSSLNNLFRREKLVKEAVKKISFEIDQGEMVGFLGPNGAGKTTTLKILSGILFPTDGIVNIDGYIPWERRNAFKKSISIVLGNKSQLIWDLPSVETLYLNKNIYEISDADYQNRLDELSEMLDVKRLLKVQARRLSLGERMKMELIAALLHRPKIIFLDEPTIGLDVVIQKRIHDFLSYYNTQYKATILLTSHNVNDVESLCKRSIIIKQGEIIFDGQTKNMDERIAKHKYISVTVKKRLDLHWLSEFGTVKRESENNCVIEVDNGIVQSVLVKIYDTLDVEDLSVENIPLEEAISSIYLNGRKVDENV